MRDLQRSLPISRSWPSPMSRFLYSLSCFSPYLYPEPSPKSPQSSSALACFPDRATLQRHLWLLLLPLLQRHCRQDRGCGKHRFNVHPRADDNDKDGGAHHHLHHHHHCYRWRSRSACQPATSVSSACNCLAGLPTSVTTTYTLPPPIWSYTVTKTKVVTKFKTVIKVLV